jgi:hypothetical protein
VSPDRLDLISRRLDLMLQERAARDEALTCAREIKAIERRLVEMRGAQHGEG